MAELMRVKLNADPEWILTGKGAMFLPDKPLPSEEEFALLDQIRGLTPEAREQVVAMVRLLAKGSTGR